MRRLILNTLVPFAIFMSAPASADTYTQGGFSGGTFGGGANVQPPFSGNGFFPGQSFTGSFVYDDQLVPAVGSGYVNVFASSYPDYSSIPAADLFTLNFGPLTFTAADADEPFAIQYNNGAFNGFFYINNFEFQGGNYQLSVQGGTFSVYQIVNGNPTFNSLMNGYINIGDNAVTGRTPYTPGNGNAVPEPGTWAMLILGFGLIGAIIRMRKQVVRSPRVA